MSKGSETVEDMKLCSEMPFHASGFLPHGIHLLYNSHNMDQRERMRRLFSLEDCMGNLMGNVTEEASPYV